MVEAFWKKSEKFVTFYPMNLSAPPSENLDKVGQPSSPRIFVRSEKSKNTAVQLCPRTLEPLLRRVNKLYLDNLADDNAVRFRNDIALLILKDKLLYHGSNENSRSRITFE